jgi:SM-20-related protein
VGVPTTDDILVLDDALAPEAFADLARFIAAEPMEYGSRSNARTDPHGHWTRKFSPAGRHNLADVAFQLADNPAFAPLDAAWRALKGACGAADALIRCYLNGYTYGTDGYFHTDSERADERTAILYMNDKWDPDWGGETVFLDGRGEILRAVLPRKNRAVVFPAPMRHAARGVSRKCVALRETLIFKARARRSAAFERLSAFLVARGALNLGHQTGTLHDHLARTFAALEARGLDEAVCLGGGLHAVYGTSIFTHSLLSAEERPAVAAAFGERAEALAHLFSILNRPATLETPQRLDPGEAVVMTRESQELALPRATFDDLRLIEAANLLDQNALAKFPALAAAWRAASPTPA